MTADTSPNSTQLLAERLRTQGLVGPPSAAPVDVVRRLLAIQAQDHVPGLWSVAQRAGHPTCSTVQAALDAGEIVRVHVLRPTWHLVAAEDFGWLQVVTGPRVRARNSSFYRRLGISDDAMAASRRIMRAALAGRNELTMAELGQALTAGGMQLGELHLVHFVMDLELRGELCSGPRHGKQHSYMLAAERIGELEPIDADEALRRLVLRYFAGHGPATLKDLQVWSSFTQSPLRAAIAEVGDALESFDVDGRIYYRVPPGGTAGVAAAAGSDESTGSAMAGAGSGVADGAADGASGIDRDAGVWLLQQFDELGIGYRESRDVLGSAPPVSQLRPGTADYLNPIVTDHGLAGWWRARATARDVQFDITPADDGLIDPDRLQAEQDRYREFRLG